MAIHEERVAHSVRGKGPAVDRDQLKPGMKIDVWECPVLKGDLGWRGPRMVFAEVEGTAGCKWKSMANRTDVAKCRLAEIPFSVLQSRVSLSISLVHTTCHVPFLCRHFGSSGGQRRELSELPWIIRNSAPRSNSKVIQPIPKADG